MSETVALTTFDVETLSAAFCRSPAGSNRRSATYSQYVSPRKIPWAEYTHINREFLFLAVLVAAQRRVAGRSLPENCDWSVIFTVDVCGRCGSAFSCDF